LAAVWLQVWLQFGYGFGYSLATVLDTGLATFLLQFGYRFGYSLATGWLQVGPTHPRATPQVTGVKQEVIRWSQKRPENGVSF